MLIYVVSRNKYIDKIWMKLKNILKTHLLLDCLKGKANWAHMKMVILLQRLSENILTMKW